MTATTFTKVAEDETYSDDYPFKTQRITTSRVDGELAEKVRARAGLTGEVLLREVYTHESWSEVTEEYGFDFDLTVGGQRVWGSIGYHSSAFEESNGPRSGLAELLRWLDRT